MTNQIEVRQFIHSRLKTSRNEIAKHFKISNARVAKMAYALIESGEIFSMPSVGYFKDIAAYRRWFSLSKAERSERARKGKVKVDTQCESRTADIIADCRNSPAMKRVLSFYGRSV